MCKCLHELDVVTLMSGVEGHGPDGEAQSVPAGSTGTVVREHPGSPWIEVEVAGPDGIPLAFVEIERNEVTVLTRLARSA